MIYTLFVLLVGIWLAQEYTYLPSVKEICIHCYKVLSDKQNQEKIFNILLKIYTFIFIIIKKLRFAEQNETQTQDD